MGTGHRPARRRVPGRPAALGLRARLVPRGAAARPGHEDEYGALVPVAAPGSVIEAELLRRKLVDAGIRATMARTVDGPRVLVFPEEARTARALLRT